MSQALVRPVWTWDAYLEWENRQEIRYELVDGQVHAMGGGTGNHDIICNNLRGELRTQLRGTPCRQQGPDFKVHAGQNGRYPDALVDCGPLPGTRLYAEAPVAVFEVLSASTAWIDQGLKLRDYDATSSIRFYALISQEENRALVYRRDATGRLGIQAAELLEGIDAALAIEDLGVQIRFADLYEGTRLAIA